VICHTFAYFPPLAYELGCSGQYKVGSKSTPVHSLFDNFAGRSRHSTVSELCTLPTTTTTTVEKA
jgi:hypothetical protein